MNLKGIISLFVLVIVGVTFLQVVADKSYENTSLPLDNITNVSHTWANVESPSNSTSSDTRWTLTTEEWYSSWGALFLTNGSALVEDTDYNVTYDNAADSVTIQLMSTVDVYDIAEDANETLAEYYRYPEEYIQGSSAARTLMDLNSLWYALGIFLFAAMGVLAYLQRNGYF